MKKIFFITVFAILGLSVNAQDKVYMPFFNIENMHWEYQVSAAKIFRTYLDNYNKYTLILPENKDTIYPKETFNQTVKNAKTVGAKYFIIGEMNALNDVMIISIKLYNTSDTSKVWSDMLKARTPDDLDPILQRFAKNIGTNQKLSVDGDIYTVSNYDSKELSKIKASEYFGLSIAGAYCMVNKVSNNFPAGFGLMGSYDIRDMIFDLQGDFLFGNIKIYEARISCLFPFATSKNSPFVGGSIAWQGTTLTYADPNPNPNFNYSYATNHNGGGLALFANAGYIFNRNSNVSFRVTVSFFFPLYKTDDSQRPLGLMLNTAILF